MSTSFARQQLQAAQRKLEQLRKKQAAAEAAAVKLDGEAATKEVSGSRTKSESSRRTYVRDAQRKRAAAQTERKKAASLAGDAAKAVGSIHEAEAKLRKEEASEAARTRAQEDKARSKAEAERRRIDLSREAAHREEVAALAARVSEQESALAASRRAAPEQITVLFITSAPQDQDGLRVDREMREIQARVRAAEHREALQFQFAVAAQPQDLLQRLNEHKPHIVHFAGHSDASGLAMEDADGLTQILTADQLGNVLAMSSDRIRLAVFNSCESAAHAEGATRYINAAIGMEQPVGDQAAMTFAGQFYSSLAFGQPLAQAFGQAVIQMDLLGGAEAVPRLFLADAVDADDTVLIKRPTV